MDENNALYRRWGNYRLFSLTNNQGTQVDISDLGATIVNFFVRDKNDQTMNIVLGYSTPSEYIQGKSYLGCVVGPWANRIANGSYLFAGQRYQLEQNEQTNHLHGGVANIGKKCWEVVEQTPQSIVMCVSVVEGEAGYPADIDLHVGYLLTDNNELCIEYKAIPHGPSPINMTQHSYFNLDGSKDILGHSIQVSSDCYLEVDNRSIPQRQSSVINTPFDLRQPTVIGDRIIADHHQVTAAQGFDHCWCFFPAGVDKFATLCSPQSGLSLEVYSDQMGMQLYSGNFLADEAGRDGQIYQQHAGVCLETQCYPDLVNMDSASQSIYDKGQVYNHRVVYKVIR
ncbi:aldose epimerase family protein [Vibrio sp. WXL103]|uniref:aldose epimerase family protein n=1 Tax=Vibrio sp. WXL103 TaxID=3450710 RepID=UPI003EC7EF9F